VTIHHNLFDRTIQRGPRVRFGQVHVYNNLYVADAATWSYAFGVGVESQIFAESNVFETIGAVTPDRFISRFNGTALTANATLVDGAPVDIVAEYNAVRDPDLSFTVSWTPTLYRKLQSVDTVAAVVKANAGPIGRGTP
jgi:pectate lyase